MNRPRCRLPYKLVMVEWLDSSRLSDGWLDLKDVPPVYPHRCVTVGFVVSENKHGKILVPTVADIEHEDNSHTYGGVMIPAGAILSVRPL